MALLEAMYPGQVEYGEAGREVVFWASAGEGAPGDGGGGGGIIKGGRNGGARLILRLPKGYPEMRGAGPEVVSARGRPPVAASNGSRLEGPSSRFWR